MAAAAAVLSCLVQSNLAWKLNLIKLWANIRQPSDTPFYFYYCYFSFLGKEARNRERERERLRLRLRCIQSSQWNWPRKTSPRLGEMQGTGLLPYGQGKWLKTGGFQGHRVKKWWPNGARYGIPGTKDNIKYDTEVTGKKIMVYGRVNRVKNEINHRFYGSREQTL